MALKVFNTLTNRKDEFAPIEPGKVRMYVCGVTVYDMCHIGHARAYISFDVIQRYLRYAGLGLTYVRNYTDVDDKIIKRAAEIGEQTTVVSERFIREFETDMDALGVAKADIEPKVTEHIPEIVALIGKIIERGHAYVAGGDVYFSVRSFPRYLQLSGRQLDEMKAGARVEVDERKQDPMDFALWKESKPGEPWWDSPWGRGRPGWHIECSAMSSKYLGDTFDIHGGGKDLIFPHHENEIAQSEAASGKKFVNYWIHNGFVNINEEKMSKSLGNFFTIREVTARFHPEALRYFMLTTHYRSPINFSDQSLEEAQKRVEYAYQTLDAVNTMLAGGEPKGGKNVNPPLVEGLIPAFREAMDDDFNAAKVLGDLSEPLRLLNELSSGKSGKPKDDVKRTLWDLGTKVVEIGSVLGIMTRDPATVLSEIRDRKVKAKNLDPEKIETLIAARAEARKAKDFARADQVRDELKSMGVAVMDTPKGTAWRVD
ncbi:MAG: cysteine--tRNA ligase [Deltaproteobacteria bacterium]|nr:cysteine--tRNA ligase [Deltaproteobacteria bacterium]